MIAALKLELAEPLADADGPFHTFDDAPLGEPFTAEERAAFDEAVEDIRAGRAHTRSGADVHADVERARRGLQRFGAAAEDADVTLGEVLRWLDTGEASPGIAGLLAGEHHADAAE